MINVHDLISELEAHQFLNASQLVELVCLEETCADAASLADKLQKRGWLTDYQVEQLLAGRGKELFLGHYLLLEPVGRGGMGQVFKARHLLMNRLAAVKIIRPDLVSGAGSLERFHREIQGLARLKHPNVVVAHDAGSTGETVFLVMEYLEGINLQQLVAGCGSLPIAESCDYIRQVALGLQHIHEHKLVHRDIKPANLFRIEQVDDTGNKWPVIKILDLGLVRLCSEGGDSVEPLTLARSGGLGTPAYIAPEQIMDSHSADIRSDIFSLGCTLYYLLTGSPAFPWSENADKWQRTIAQEPAPLAAARPEAPAQLVDIVHRMMAKEPGDRYQTPREIAEALAPFCSGFVNTSLPHDMTSKTNGPTPTQPYDLFDRTPHEAILTAPPKPIATDSHKQAARGRYLWLGVVGGLVLAGLVGLFLFGPGQHLLQVNPKIAKGDEEEKVVPPIPRIDPTKLHHVFDGHNDWISSVAFLPQGDRLLSAGADGIYLWDVSTHERTPILEGKLAGIRSLAIAPDGSFLLAGTQDHNQYLFMWNIPAQKPVALPILHVATVRCVAVSADGQQALSADSEKNLWLWDLSTKKVVQRLQCQGLPRCVHFVDGNYVVCVSWEPTHQDEGRLSIQRWDTKTAKETQAAVISPPINCAAFTKDGQYVLVGSATGRLTLRAVSDGREVRRFKNTDDTPILCVALSSDAKRALSGNGDGVVRLWDVETGLELHALTGHSRPVQSVAFSPDNRHAASAGEDRTLRLWGPHD